MEVGPFKEPTRTASPVTASAAISVVASVVSSADALIAKPAASTIAIIHILFFILCRLSPQLRAFFAFPSLTI